MKGGADLNKFTMSFEDPTAISFMGFGGNMPYVSRSNQFPGLGLGGNNEDWSRNRVDEMANFSNNGMDGRTRIGTHDYGAGGRVSRMDSGHAAMRLNTPARERVECHIVILRSEAFTQDKV